MRYLILILIIAFFISGLLRAEVCKSSIEGKETLQIPLNTKAKEISLKINSFFPEQEKLYNWELTHKLERVSEPDRACLIVEYTDGARDKFVPFCVNDNKFGFIRGEAEYVIHPQYKTIDSLKLIDNGSDASYSIEISTNQQRRNSSIFLRI
jgi:hypothetical protein